jgi:hypothetical protein
VDTRGFLAAALVLRLFASAAAADIDLGPIQTRVSATIAALPASDRLRKRYMKAVALLERLRHLLRERGHSVKTTRNIVDGTFRALYRDARREGLVDGDPFIGLEWPRLPGRAPDPYT